MSGILLRTILKAEFLGKHGSSKPSMEAVKLKGQGQQQQDWRAGLRDDTWAIFTHVKKWTKSKIQHMLRVGKGSMLVCCLNSQPWDVPGGPLVKTSSSNAGDAGLIPHAFWPEHQNIKQKQCCNKFDKDLKRMGHIKKILKKNSLPWLGYKNILHDFYVSS